jgi:hypothetical protein
MTGVLGMQRTPLVFDKFNLHQLRLDRGCVGWGIRERLHDPIHRDRRMIYASVAVGGSADHVHV